MKTTSHSPLTSSWLNTANDSSAAPAGGSLPSDLSDKVAKNLTREGYKIKDYNGDGEITVSYAFDKFSEAKKRAFRQALRSWEDVIKVKFIENGKNADSHVTVKEREGGGGSATMPNAYRQMDINIGKNEGDGLHSSMVHEIGHTLGLGHPEGDYPENRDIYSTMSYGLSVFRPTSNKPNTFVSDSTQTPMMHDIAGVHLIYKPNHETRKGNTTYGFNSNTERDHYTLTSAKDLPFFCVWDNGGEDTLDFSGFKQDQKINLNAESLSNIGGREGNVSIAKGVRVENAIGGSGNDVVIGNRDNNRITGGAGQDTLIGGEGADTFVYNKVSDSSLSNPDILEDFTSGTDKIDLSKLLNDAGIKALNLVERHTGKKGELTLDYDANIKMHRLILNVSGDPDASLIILSMTPIKLDDIVTGTHPQRPTTPPPINPDVTPLPKPTPKPKPKPESTPTPEPEPEPEPTPQPPATQHPKHDTVYGFNATTGNTPTSLTSGRDKPNFYVDDSKGNDTLDFSGFSQAQKINLSPGAQSSVGGMVENILITPQTIIENAIGGTGNDHIIGNAADNVLVGGGGADNLAGKGGFNTFKYDLASDSPRNNADLLMDFTSGKDKIDLSKMSENAQIALNYVSQYSGRPGDTILAHSPTTNRYFVGVDLTGNGKTDFLIKSTRPISSEDIIGLNIQEDGYF